MLIPALFSFAVFAVEVPQTLLGPNPMQFTGRVFTFAANDPLSPATKIGYTALLLDEEMTVLTDIGDSVKTDRVQFSLDDGDNLPNGAKVKLNCGFVMGAETHHHFEPLFCGQSEVTVLQ